MLLYAYYSKQAERMAGATIWLLESGGPVRCTAVCDSHEWAAKEYRWADKVYVGPVVEFIRRDSDGMTLAEILREILQ